MPLAFLPFAAASNVCVVPVLGWVAPAGYEWVVIGLLGLLIFGKRLPAAARGLGESFQAFRQGLSGKGGAEPGGDQASVAEASADLAPRLLGSPAGLTRGTERQAGQPLVGN